MYKIMRIIHEDQTNGKGVLDGSALVHMLMSHKYKTVDDYAEKVFLPRMLEKLESADLLDAGQATREKR